MSFDGNASRPAATQSAKSPPVKIRDVIELTLAAGMIAAFVSLNFTIADVKTLVDKHNDLTSQQIAVTRSMHHVQELATAYLEGRKASGAAEEHGVPLEIDSNDR